MCKDCALIPLEFLPTGWDVMHASSMHLCSTSPWNAKTVKVERTMRIYLIISLCFASARYLHHEMSISRAAPLLENCLDGRNGMLKGNEVAPSRGDLRARCCIGDALNESIEHHGSLDPLCGFILAPLPFETFARCVGVHGPQHPGDCVTCLHE